MRKETSHLPHCFRARRKNFDRDPQSEFVRQLRDVARHLKRLFDCSIALIVRDFVDNADRCRPDGQLND